MSNTIPPGDRRLKRLWVPWSGIHSLVRAWALRDSEQLCTAADLAFGGQPDRLMMRVVEDCHFYSAEGFGVLVFHPMFEPVADGEPIPWYGQEPATKIPIARLWLAEDGETVLVNPPA